MNSGLFRRYLIYFLLLVVIQIPLLHNWVIFDRAFPFLYIGFILLLPVNQPRAWTLIIAFFLGLLVDVFSSTPGIHASASVLVSFIRLFWLGVVAEGSNDELDLTISHLKFSGFTLFIAPLVFVHHFTLFLIENEGFQMFGSLLAKVFWSTLLSSFLIWTVAMLVSPKRRRI